MLLDSMPKQIGEHYERKILVFLHWYAERGYPNDIPDEGPITNASGKPSWKRICKVLPTSPELARAVELDGQAEAGKRQPIAMTDLGQLDEDVVQAASVDRVEAGIQAPQPKRKPGRPRKQEQDEIPLDGIYEEAISLTMSATADDIAAAKEKSGIDPAEDLTMIDGDRLAEYLKALKG